MNQDQNTIETIHRMDKRLERIEMVLLGDEQAEQEGLVHKVKKQSQYIETDKKNKNKIIGGIIVGTPIFIVFWEKFLQIIGLK